jgi:hypothetical protein
MPDQDDFPDEWQCRSVDKDVIVEIKVPEEIVPYDLTTGEPVDEPDGFFTQNVITEWTWVEIPTSSVELWVEKGDAAQIQRTAKVRFPTDWGQDRATVEHNSPRKLIDQFNPENPKGTMQARIWFQDDNSSQWILEHLGWVGGVGAASDPSMSKLWVYDFAELLTGVPIGLTVNAPRLGQMVEILAEETNKNTPIPVSQAIIVPPQTEEEFAKTFEGEPPFRDVDQSGDTVLDPEDRSGSTYYGFTSADEGIIQFDDQLTEAEETVQSTYEATRILPENIDQFSYTPYKKSWTANHDTLLEVYKWFEARSNTNLHFEPRANTVALVADVTPSRRVFAQPEAYEKKRDDQDADYEVHDFVNVINNDALYEIKPHNTLHLRGSTNNNQGGFLDSVAEGVSNTVGDIIGNNSSEKYPVVKAQVPALVEAANGTELSDGVVESDAATLDQAEFEAKRRLSDMLQEATEGSIMMYGQPRLRPYDRIDSFEACQGLVEYEQTPVAYEVESVKHVKEAGEPYKCVVDVSVWANDKNIEIKKSTLVKVNN